MNCTGFYSDCKLKGKKKVNVKILMKTKNGWLLYLVMIDYIL